MVDAKKTEKLFRSSFLSGSFKRANISEGWIVSFSFSRSPRYPTSYVALRNCKKQGRKRNEHLFLKFRYDVSEQRDVISKQSSNYIRRYRSDRYLIEKIGSSDKSDELKLVTLIEENDLDGRPERYIPHVNTLANVWSGSVATAAASRRQRRSFVVLDTSVVLVGGGRAHSLLGDVGALCQQRWRRVRERGVVHVQNSHLHAAVSFDNVKYNELKLISRVRTVFCISKYTCSVRARTLKYLEKCERHEKLSQTKIVRYRVVRYRGHATFSFICPCKQLETCALRTLQSNLRMETCIFYDM